MQGFCEPQWVIQMNTSGEVKPVHPNAPSAVSFLDLATLELKSLESNGFTVSAKPGTFDPDVVYCVEMPAQHCEGETAYRSRAILSCESARSQVASFFILSDDLY